MVSTEVAKGLFIIEPDVFRDNRGVFNVIFKDYDFDLVQINQSVSMKNVLRGLHFQDSPNEQSKIVWVSKGMIKDVVVDLRENSETFGQHFEFILDDLDRRTLLIPKGFAHGFLCLSEQAIVNYAVDNIYSPEDERCIYAFDEDLNIRWGIDKFKEIMSTRDNLGQSFKDFKIRL